MLIGYARVSTQDQNLSLQKDALKKADCERIFTDKMTGAATTRSGLDKPLDVLRAGDTLVVWKLDRLGRSLSHLVELVNQLKERGVGFRSLQENIDTTSGVGKLVFHIFASLAEFERDLIRERTMAGLESARARGRHGRSSESIEQEEGRYCSSMHRDKNLTVSEICETLGIGKTTFYRYVNKLISAKTGEAGNHQPPSDVVRGELRSMGLGD